MRREREKERKDNNKRDSNAAIIIEDDCQKPLRLSSTKSEILLNSVAVNRVHSQHALILPTLSRHFCVLSEENNPS